MGKNRIRGCADIVADEVAISPVGNESVGVTYRG